MLTTHTLPAWLHSIHHDGSDHYVSNLYPRLGERVHLRLRLPVGAPVQRVFLRSAPDGEQRLTSMSLGPQEGTVRWWEATLPVEEPLLHYRFLLEAADGIWWYNGLGPSSFNPLDSADFRLLAGYQAPTWLEQAVFYQVFPDRFANGNPATDPKPDEYQFQGQGPITLPWGAPPPADHLFPLIFYGGDLPGLTERLDYVEQLGVNALYLNPIFTAYSNHKYDVADYEHVDPHLGGDQALIDLRQALAQRNMRYLLDIVPNHCGYWHPWFQAAREDAGSPEAGFFTFSDHPDGYASWLGVWTLPKLNYNSPELRRRIYEDRQSVVRRWLQAPFGADGWRVDVANMLGRQGASQLGVEVAQGIRQAVKATRPDAYLLGENFFDATAQLQGDQWDGVMNYAGFSQPLRHWLGGFHQGAWGLKDRISSPYPWPTAAMAGSWRSRLAAIPWAIARQQYNLLGSHDTPRIATLTGGQRALQELAATLLLTFPGVPGVYYGDEIGMADLPGLGSRGCMVWEQERWDQGLLDRYRRLIALRRRSPILQRGGFQLLAVEADTIAYQREAREGRILVVAHRSTAARPSTPLPVAHGGISDGSRFVEHFSGREVVVEQGHLSIGAHPQGATVWEEVGT